MLIMKIRQQQGFNLIEVLVALVVLTLGLLGIAGLQLSSIRNTQSSYSRSIAIAAANDLAERMYANTPGALAGNYNALDSGVAGFCAAPPVICAQESTAAAVPAACTPAQMAAYDFFNAACGMPSATGRVGGVNDMLPAGRIRTICAGVCPPAVLRITVTWTDRGLSGNNNVQAQATSQESVTMVVQP